MAGHTQGPWKVKISTGFVRTDDGRAVAAVYGDSKDCSIDQCAIERARLIAAAPDLLAALETAAARFNMMAGVGLVNGADPKVGYRECMDALHLAKHGAA